jgi:hypothetical protein
LSQFQQIEPLRQNSLHLHATLSIAERCVLAVNNTLSTMDPLPGIEDLIVLGATFHIAPFYSHGIGELRPLVFQTALHVRGGAGIAVSASRMSGWLGEIETRPNSGGLRFIPYSVVGVPIQATIHAELPGMLDALFGLLRDHLTRLA